MVEPFLIIEWLLIIESVIVTLSSIEQLSKITLFIIVALLLICTLFGEIQFTSPLATCAEMYDYNVPTSNMSPLTVYVLKRFALDSSGKTCLSKEHGISRFLFISKISFL